jgi:hypothetical protein
MCTYREVKKYEMWATHMHMWHGSESEATIRVSSINKGFAVLHCNQRRVREDTIYL